MCVCVFSKVGQPATHKPNGYISLVAFVTRASKFGHQDLLRVGKLTHPAQEGGNIM